MSRRPKETKRLNIKNIIEFHHAAHPCSCEQNFSYTLSVDVLCDGVCKVDGSFHVLVAAAAEPASFHLPSRHPLGCHIIDPSFLPSPQGFTNSTFPSHSTPCSTYIHNIHIQYMEKHFTRTRSAACQCPAHPKKKKKKKKKHREIPHSHIEDHSNFVAFPSSRSYWRDGLRVTSSLLSIQHFPRFGEKRQNFLRERNDTSEIFVIQLQLFYLLLISFFFFFSFFSFLPERGVLADFR